MGKPKNNIKDNGMDAPDQDWQWELLERSLEQAKTANSSRHKTRQVLSGQDKNALTDK